MLVLCKQWARQVVGGKREVLSLALLSGILTLLPVLVPVGGGLLTILAPFPLIVWQ